MPDQLIRVHEIPGRVEDGASFSIFFLLLSFYFGSSSQTYEAFFSYHREYYFPRIPVRRSGKGLV